MRAIDFFCGAGGLTKGLSKAGISVLAGIDIDESFRQTYEFNNKESKFVQKNIKELDHRLLCELIPDLVIDDSEMLFAGCAPCQAFSQQRRSTVKRSDEDALIYFGNLVKYFLPGQVFVENVKGLAKTKVFAEFYSVLEQNNYSIWFDILNAKNFGVPQQRKRLVLIAMRNKIVVSPNETHGKNALPLRTVHDAIAHFPTLEVGEVNEKIPNHIAANVTNKNLQRLKNTPHDGGSWISWPDDLKLECHKKTTGYTDIYGRMSWKKQSPTITCKCNSISNGRYGHPNQDRAISLREAAALQSFPDNYVFFGTQGSIAKQIGNAVPVEMANALGKHIKKLRYDK